MKDYIKIINIQDNIYGTHVIIIGNASEKEANKYLKKIGNRYLIEEQEYMEGTLIKSNYDVYRILYIKKLNKKNLPKLAHEIFHLVVRICSDKGVPIVPNIQTGECGDEAAAYLMEYYFDQIYKRL